MLAYFLKVNVAIVLFYAFYRLFFYKDTFFGWRRTALLCFFAVSAAVPLLNIQTWITEQEPMVAMADLYASVVLPELTIGTEAAPTDWKSILSEYANIAYWGIVALLMIRLIMQLAGIIHLACRCRKVQIGNTNIHLLPKADGPFSFFHWIFIHPSSHTEEEFNEILTHEQTHARQWHSIDVIISELVCIFCWCNPFAWLMKREIRTNLEYMADARVLENGYDSKTYQYHLLGLSHQKAAATIYNSFNVLPLKKRIKMMNKKRTKGIGRTKYLMFLPLAALLMIVSNIEAVARTTKKIAAEVIEAVDAKTGQAVPEVQAPQVAPLPEQDTKTVTYKGKVVDKDTLDNPIFEVVEHMPEFPDGGMSALMEYLSKNIKYPEAAMKKGTTLLLLLVSLTFPWIKYLNEFNANLRIFRKPTSNSELINLNVPAVCIFFCQIEKNMAVDNLLLAKIVYLCRRSEDWRHLSIKNERVHFILHSVCAVFVAMNSFTLNKAEIWEQLNRCCWECASYWVHAQARLLLCKPQRRELNGNGRMVPLLSKLPSVRQDRRVYWD